MNRCFKNLPRLLVKFAHFKGPIFFIVEIETLNLAFQFSFSFSSIFFKRSFTSGLWLFLLRTSLTSFKDHLFLYASRICIWRLFISYFTVSEHYLLWSFWNSLLLRLFFYQRLSWHRLTNKTNPCFLVIFAAISSQAYFNSRV